MQTVLVTGASGFVGRMVCRVLAEGGWRVRAAARRPLEAPAGGEVFATGDFSQFRSWQPLLQGVDAVVHLANAAHVRARSGQALAAARALNVEATLRLAQAAAAAGTSRFLYVSSVKVYGDETGTAPFTESSPLAPRDPYAALKVEAERGLQQLSAGTGLSVTVLRPPLVYGPGVKANFLALMRLVALRTPLPFAAISNRRSLLFVGNLASAIRHALERPSQAGGAFLLADDEALSTPELCRALAIALGRRAWLFRCAPRVLEWLPGMRKLTRSLQVDDRLFRAALGWSPPFSVEQALAQTARWYLGPGGGPRG